MNLETQFQFFLTALFRPYNRLEPISFIKLYYFSIIHKGISILSLFLPITSTGLWAAQTRQYIKRLIEKTPTFQEETGGSISCTPPIPIGESFPISQK